MAEAQVLLTPEANLPPRLLIPVAPIHLFIRIFSTSVPKPNGKLTTDFNEKGGKFSIIVIVLRAQKKKTNALQVPLYRPALIFLR
jgi:hypothetical protein